MFQVADTAGTVVFAWTVPDRPSLTVPSPVRGVPDLPIYTTKIHNLKPGRLYQVKLTSDSGTARRVAQFHTLPESLPFMVYAGSCYYSENDALTPIGAIVDTSTLGVVRGWRNLSIKIRRSVHFILSLIPRKYPPTLFQGGLARRYASLWRKSKETPSVKVLMGDQVYADQPPERFLNPLAKPDHITRWIARSYLRSWDGMGSFLRTGANICISDDHEYWNDYPHKPLYPALRATQNAWTETAVDAFRAFQLGCPLTPIEIGMDHSRKLSVRVADTRLNRTPVGNGDQFLAEPDLHEIQEWLAQLKCPGVLVLGQPVFVRPGDRTDRNLQSYERQFRLLWESLLDARHDIVVLCGDVHYGRVSRMTITPNGPTGTPHQIVEVISSPMAILNTAIAPPFRLTESTSSVERMLAPAAAARGYAIKLSYEQAVSGLTSIQCSNHLYSLTFTDGPRGGVTVKIAAHLVQKRTRLGRWIDEPCPPIELF